MASLKVVKRPWSDDEWRRIEEGHARLLDLHNVVLPALDKYQFHVPEVSQYPDEVLRRKAKAQLERQGKNLWDHYVKRMNTELKVIKEMGFANYFLMAEDIVGWCKKNGVFVDARGSANGSLVCFLLGVTTIDPVEWDCDFDRFLSIDRMKPPDIDMDVEHDARADLIDYVRSKYPTMVQIGSYSRIGVTETTDGEEKGSVYVQYAAAMRRKKGSYDGIEAGHHELLEAMAQVNVRKSAGRHAGGFVIPGKDLAIEDYIPTMLVGGKKGELATQFTMDDVEDCGYVKLDILGVKVLSIMRRVMELIGKDPIKDGMTWIPFDDPQAIKILRSGVVGNGIFQFEGYSTAKGARQMKVSNTQEAIFCLALFRPAMMQSGMTDKYLAARSEGVRRTLHPGIDRIMEATMGVPVFQDQVIQIMRAVGLPFADLNDILKAVKASNDKITAAEAVFRRVYPIFLRKAMTLLGCDRATADLIWQTVMDFSDYGFNRSHATNYGVRAYRMAYLKAHYPEEFMTATLDVWGGTDKESLYVSEARRLKIPIGRPDVNKSSVNWTLDRSGKRPLLRKGLLSVKGVGLAAAQAIVDERAAGGDYDDERNFGERLPARAVTGTNDLAKGGDLKGTCLALFNGRAFTSLGYTPD